MTTTTQDWIAVMNVTRPPQAWDWIATMIESRSRDFWNWRVSCGSHPSVIEISDTSDNGHWQALPNPTAGLREAEWLGQHRAELADEHQPWVAILGNDIVARGDSPMTVYSAVRDQGIADALIALVRPRTGPRAHRIA